MNTLDQVVKLIGPRFAEITVVEFRKRPGDILQQVGFGRTFLITKNGKPVAVLSQPPGDTLTTVYDKNGKKHYTP